MKITPLLTQSKQPSPNFKKWVYGSETSSSSVYRDSSPDTFEYSTESSSYPTMEWVSTYEDYFTPEMVLEDVEAFEERGGDWEPWLKLEATNRVHKVNMGMHAPSGIINDFREYQPVINMYVMNCKIERIKQELEKLEQNIKD